MLTHLHQHVVARGCTQAELGQRRVDDRRHRRFCHEQRRSSVPSPSGSVANSVSQPSAAPPCTRTKSLPSTRGRRCTKSLPSTRGRRCRKRAKPARQNVSAAGRQTLDRFGERDKDELLWVHGTKHEPDSQDRK
jgi:hypothetical protein